MDNSIKTIKIQQRLLCPLCGEGVIKIPQEERDHFHERSVIFPRKIDIDMPTCNYCRKTFIVKIDKTLLITFEPILWEDLV